MAGGARPNALRAVAFDLKSFFSVVDKEPAEVVAADVFEFLAHQRGDRTVIRMGDRESGLSACTIARRLSSVAGFYAYLIARGDNGVATNPVPRGLSTRRRGGRARTVPLVRVSRQLPKILEPEGRVRWWRRCGPIVIGRWCWPCWSVACVAARCWGYASPMSASLTAWAPGG